MNSLLKDNAALEAQDAASHGYNGRTGDGARLLKACASAVRIASRQVQAIHAVPAVSADERAEYSSDLVARIVGEHGGRIPAADTLATSYLVKRAAGIILNDQARRVVGFGDFEPEPGRDGGAGEACGDDRLTGPLEITGEVLELAAELGLSETATKALAACMIPATRAEWADLHGYSSAKAFHVTAWRGRSELMSIGESEIRAALAKIENH